MLLVCFFLGVVLLIVAGWLLNEGIRQKNLAKIAYFGCALMAGCYYITAMVGYIN